MKQIFLFAFFLNCTFPALAINVKGPDGYVLIIAFAVILLFVFIYLIFRWIRNKNNQSKHGQVIFRKKQLSVTLEKNKLYFPDYIKLSVRNKGKADIDLDRPLLTFSNMFWRRKFRLKGTSSYQFYPLLLEPGKVHDLTIDLNHFYRYDAHLKKFSKVTVTLKDVNGNYSASKSVMLRKTLFR